MSLDAKKIIIGVLCLGYIIYLYILLDNWQLASGGNIFIGIIQGIIPLIAIVFVSLVLYKKIKISIPI